MFFTGLLLIAALAAMPMTDRRETSGMWLGQMSCSPGPIRLNPQDMLAATPANVDEQLRRNPQQVLTARCELRAWPKAGRPRDELPSPRPANPSNVGREAVPAAR
jgi:hypothetical protein